MKRNEASNGTQVSSIVTSNGIRVTFGERSLEVIASEIKRCQDFADESYLKTGKLLLEAKGHFGQYGEWIDWLKANVDFSISKAQRLMRVAKWMDSNEAPVPHLPFSHMYLLSRLSNESLKNFLMGKQVETMSKRELQQAVCDYLRKKSNHTPTVATTAQHEVIASEEDELRQRFERLKSDVAKIAGLIKGNPNFEPLAAELCELVIQQLSMEDLEAD